MSDLESRIRAIEDRAAIEAVLLDYYRAVDTLSDLDGLVACFTEDAAFDVTKLGLPRLVGRDAIRGFFAGVFADTAAHCHHLSNVRVPRLDGDSATAHAYVIGRASGRSGAQVFVHCFIDLELVRTAAGWKITLFDEGALMPFGEEMQALHASA